jgi:hypothetical protein
MFAFIKQLNKNTRHNRNFLDTYFSCVTVTRRIECLEKIKYFTSKQYVAIDIKLIGKKVKTKSFEYGS